MSSTQLDLQKLVVMHPTSRSMRFTKFDSNDRRYSAVFIGCSLLPIGATSGLLNKLVIGLLLALWFATMCRTEKSDERVYIIPFTKVKSWWIVKVRDGYLWRTSSTEPGEKKRRERRMIMPVEIYEIGNIGLAYTPRNKSDAIVLTASGGPLASQSLKGQFIGHQEIATIIKRLAAVANTPLKVSFMVRTRPENRWQHWNTLVEFGHGDAVLPVGLEKDEADLTDFDRRMLQLQQVQLAELEIYDESNDIDMVMVVSLRRPEVLRTALRKKSISKRDMSRQPIVKIREIALSSLRQHGLVDVEVLDADGIEQFLRKSWDVATLSAYYDHAQQRLQSDEDDSEEDSTHWFPSKHIRVGDDYVDIDGTFGATLRCSAIGRSAQLPHEMRGFHVSPCRWSASTVLGETVNGDMEYRLLNMGSAFLESALEVLNIERRGPRAQRKVQSREDRLDEIDSATFTQAFNHYVGVSASSHDELEDEVEREFQRLTAEGKRPLRVTGAARQLPAYLSATMAISLD